MSKRVKVHVGKLQDMGQRFVSAWHRLERGERVRERLGRDYKRVYEGVETLAATGLLQREDGRVSASYDAISAAMRL